MAEMKKSKKLFETKQTLLILRGIPGCGKTTFAKDLQSRDPSYKRVNRDDLRAMIDNSVWSKTNEDIIRTVRNQIISIYLQAGFNVIVDDTNLQQSVVEEIKKIGFCCNPNLEVVITDFDVPLDVCLARNANRQGTERVPDSVIHKFYADFRKILDNEVWIKSTNEEDSNKA